VVEMEARLQGQDIAFDAPADDDSDARPAPIAFLIDQAANPYESLETSDAGERHLDSLAEGLEKLDPRSRDIVSRRWLAEPKSTLQELADEYKVSAERIRQIEAAAFKKMRSMFAD